MEIKPLHGESFGQVLSNHALALADRGVSFPNRRMRRLRQTPTLRRLVAETRATVDDLIASVLSEKTRRPQPIDHSGVMQHTQESIDAEVKELVGLGILVVLGLPGRKDPTGSKVNLMVSVHVKEP